ncbi:MAG: RHS repeat-associated core domain-containing protein [Planctomycetota bacterium]
MFTGRRFDIETGLYYYRARYYNPHIGRFMQTDPVGYADGINWYLYVKNNPLAYVDPSGQHLGWLFFWRATPTDVPVGPCKIPPSGRFPDKDPCAKPEPITKPKVDPGQGRRSRFPDKSGRDVRQYQAWPRRRPRGEIERQLWRFQRMCPDYVHKGRSPLMCTQGCEYVRKHMTEGGGCADHCDKGGSISISACIIGATQAAVDCETACDAQDDAWDLTPAVVYGAARNLTYNLCDVGKDPWPGQK